MKKRRERAVRPLRAAVATKGNRGVSEGPDGRCGDDVDDQTMPDESA
jgi:hypothetical protein